MLLETAYHCCWSPPIDVADHCLLLLLQTAYHCCWSSPIDVAEYCLLLLLDTALAGSRAGKQQHMVTYNTKTCFVAFGPHQQGVCQHWLPLHPMARPCLIWKPALDASAAIIFYSTTIRFLLPSDSCAKQRTASTATTTTDAVQAVKDEYQVTLVGHSLGAGAAALLAMMLRAKGITNMHCYAFAPPMCCEPDLAASCSDHVTSIVFRDDIISRY